MQELIDPVEYAENLEYNRDDQVAVGAKWKGCHFPSLELFKSWTGHGYLVWPNEGLFDLKKNFQFFEDYKNFEPLLVDLNLARLLVQLCEISEKGKEIFETKAVKNRHFFVKLAEICWKHATFGG
jgi:hypothetical protein